MDSLHHASSVIFVNKAGQFVLQLRDDKPGIRSPGMIAPWGGAAEGTETPLETAIREVAEETDLSPAAADFEFFGDYLRQIYVKGKQVINHVFILRNVNELKIRIHEGRQYVLVDPHGPPNPLYTKLTNELIRDYLLAI